MSWKHYVAGGATIAALGLGGLLGSFYNGTGYQTVNRSSVTMTENDVKENSRIRVVSLDDHLAGETSNVSKSSLDSYTSSNVSACKNKVSTDSQIDVISGSSKSEPSDYLQ